MDDPEEEREVLTVSDEPDVPPSPKWMTAPQTMRPTFKLAVPLKNKKLEPEPEQEYNPLTCCELY